MPHLVKDKVVRLRARSRSVQSKLDMAMRISKEQGWTKVLIIGEGRGGGHFIKSCMHDYTAIGMAEQLKHELIKGE